MGRNRQCSQMRRQDCCFLAMWMHLKVLTSLTEMTGPPVSDLPTIRSRTAGRAFAAASVFFTTSSKARTTFNSTARLPSLGSLLYFSPLTRISTAILLGKEVSRIHSHSDSVQTQSCLH